LGNRSVFSDSAILGYHSSKKDESEQVLSPLGAYSDSGW
jgi:hypothetical protein